MRWIIGKLLTIPVVLFIVVVILVSVTTPVLDKVMMTTIQVEVKRAILANPHYANLPLELKKKIAENLTRYYIHAFGLDQPWYVKVFKYSIALLTFQPIYARALTTQIINPGSSNAYLIVFERIPFTIYLFTTSTIVSLIFAIPLGLLAARKPGGIVDKIVSVWSIFSISMPWWWVAMVMIWIFAYTLHWFLGPDAVIDWTNPLQVLQRAALPVLTISLASIGVVAYRVRSILLDVLTEDFVMAERAKGVPERRVLWHVLRVAAPPIVTIVLLSIVLSIVSGAIITEAVFNWFGLGTLYWQAIVANDIPVILVLTYISTLLYLVTRFVLDILYVYLDPRIRRA